MALNNFLELANKAAEENAANNVEDFKVDKVYLENNPDKKELKEGDVIKVPKGYKNEPKKPETAAAPASKTTPTPKKIELADDEEEFTIDDEYIKAHPEDKELKAGEKGKRKKTTPATPNAADDSIDDDATLKAMNKKFGTDFKNLDEFKRLIGKVDPTPEEKEILDRAKEKTVLDEFLTFGRHVGEGTEKKFIPNTLDDFHRIKSTLAKDDATLAKEYIRAELVELGTEKPSEEEVNTIFKSRYMVKESDDDVFSEHEVKLGQHLLKQEGARIRYQVGFGLTQATKSVQARQTEEQATRQWAEKVDNYIKNEMPRKFTLEIGQKGETDLGNFEYTINDAEVEEIKTFMRDPQGLTKLISGDGKTTDLNKYSEVVMPYIIGKKIMAAMAMEMHSKGVELISSTLNNDPDLTKLGKNTGDGVDLKKQKETAITENVNTAAEAFGTNKPAAIGRPQ